MATLRGGKGQRSEDSEDNDVVGPVIMSVNTGEALGAQGTAELESKGLGEREGTPSSARFSGPQGT
jgi:hypothetical protein